LLVFDIINNYITVAFILIGWTCMVTGQSLVLYSRLHIIVSNVQKLKWILAMIILDGIILHPTVAALAMKVGLVISNN
jgi:hypothetical protein